jgi:tellurite resistance protein
MLQDPDAQTLDAIGFLFLACSHGVDASLEERERDLIVHKMSGRLVSATETTVYEAVRRALALYKDPQTQADVDARVRVTATMLASALVKADQEQLLADLTEVAESDGVMSVPERNFVTTVAQAFGVSLSVK